MFGMDHGTYGLMASTSDMVDMGRTTIQVPEELADELYGMKQRGDSYADVIFRLLDRPEPVEQSERSQERDMVARVENINWDGQGGAKNEERVRALASAAALLRDRGECAPVILRRHIEREYDLGLKESSVQRLVSDNLPKIGEVETESNGQIYVWNNG